MSRPRVVVVDDSPFAREALTRLLEEGGELEVVGTAADGAAALEAVARLRPDVVTMDIAMPDADGIDAIEQIMARHPVPIVVVSALAASGRALDAVRRGALEVALKPTTAADAEALRRVVRRAATVPVVRHVTALRLARARRASEAPPALLGEARIVGLAASAGGPAAVTAVLAALPARLGACVAVVQHLPPDFIASFAGFLRANTGHDVELVASGERVAVRPGLVVVAAGGCHLVASGPHTLGADDAPPFGGHRPSATLLFRSLARWQGSQAIGVVLTGIGDDGARGLLEMRALGATVIAQDEATAAVYGMPRAAVEIGAATEVAPLGDIAAAVMRALGPR